MEIEITKEDSQKFNRLDRCLAAKMSPTSRSFLQKLFANGHIYTKDQALLNLKKMPPTGTTFHISLPPSPAKKPQGEDISLKIVYEDEHLMAINKPAGMVVYPSQGNHRGTLINALLHYYPPIEEVGESNRPGIVHRLDKGTNGLLVVAKTNVCYEQLVPLFKNHSIKRTYQAIVQGQNIPIAGKIESTIGRNPSYPLRQKINVPRGKKAITHYRVEEYLGHMAHLEIKLETGRTHQIRVHTSSLLKAPIVGDTLYGRFSQHPQYLNKLLKVYPHPLLHAKALEFIHPLTKEKCFFSAPPPKIFTQCLKILRIKNGKTTPT